MEVKECKKDEAKDHSETERHEVFLKLPSKIITK